MIGLKQLGFIGYNYLHSNLARNYKKKPSISQACNGSLFIFYWFAPNQILEVIKFIKVYNAVYPNSKIYLVTDKIHEPLLQSLEVNCCVISIKRVTKRLGIQSFFNVWKKIKTIKPSLVVDFHGTSLTQFFTLQSGALSMGLVRGEQSNVNPYHYFINSMNQPLESIVKKFMVQLNLPTDAVQLSYKSLEQFRPKLELILSKEIGYVPTNYLIVHLTYGNMFDLFNEHQKNWYQFLHTLQVKCPTSDILLTGFAADVSYHTTLIDLLNKHTEHQICSLAGKLTWREALLLAKGATTVFTNYYPMQAPLKVAHVHAIAITPRPTPSFIDQYSIAKLENFDWHGCVPIIESTLK